MKSAKRQREKGASDTEDSERASAKKSKTQVSLFLTDCLFVHWNLIELKHFEGSGS